MIWGGIIDNLFKVLGDENRLKIINLLRKEELCVCEIEAILDTTQSNVSIPTAILIWVMIYPR